MATIQGIVSIMSYEQSERRSGMAIVFIEKGVVKHRWTTIHQMNRLCRMEEVMGEIGYRYYVY